MDYSDNEWHTQGTQEQRKKKRVRTWTAHDRAAHRVFEKSRREAFNNELIVSCLVPSEAFFRPKAA